MRPGLLKKLTMALLMTCGSVTHAQDLPGVTIQEANVSQSAISLIRLAQRAIPDLFSQASDWRSYEGFTYRYFGSSGVYVGFVGTELYLMGGPFGPDVTYQGTILDALQVVKGELSTPDLPFEDLITASSVHELISYFNKITMEFGQGPVVGTMTIERQGSEALGNIGTEKVLVNLDANNLSGPARFEMWVASNGFIHKLIYNGFDYGGQSNAVGNALVSGVLGTLKGADTPFIRAAVNNEIQNSALSQKTIQRQISGINTTVLQLTVSSSPTASVVTELADFGPFSMAITLDATLGSTKNYFKITEIVPR